MMRYKVARPRWWPGQEPKAEPLTTRPGRGTALAVGLMLVLGFLFLEVFVPATQGEKARPPLGILFDGAVHGALVGLTAVGLILIYRTTRIINFAQAALGSSAGIFVSQMVIGYDFPLWVVIPIGLVIGVGAGVLAELLLRRFSKAPRLVTTIATVAMAPLLSQLMGSIISQLNPLPPGVDRTLAAFKTVPPLFPNFKFTIAPLTFNSGHVITIAGAVALMAGLSFFLRRTRLGQAVRASSENPEAAWLLGMNIRSMSTLVWAIAAFLSAFASITTLTMNGIDTSGSDSGAAQLLPAIVAAVVAGMETMPLALFFAIWFQVMVQGIHWAYPSLSFAEVAMLATLLIALVLQKRRLQRRESKGGSAWDAARDIRRTPRELLVVPVIRNGRYVMGGLVLAAVALFPWVTSAGQTHGGGLVLIYVMITLSLLLLTGWAGQVSLGQFAIVAVGAVLGGGLTAHMGWNFWIALPVASLAGAGLAIVLGLPALRLNGLYLAAVTLGFAVAIPATLFNETLFGWILPQGTINRPQLFFIDFNDERSFYYFLAGCTLATLALVYKLRGSRPGRVLIALRDNEPAAQSVGISALRSRLAIFALSGFVAAVAGVLLAHFQQSISVKDFLPGQSISVFLMLVLGGIGSISGAVLGGVYGAACLYLIPDFANLATGATAFLILFMRPDGLAGILYSTRDALLRVVALRQHIVVPSLFADYDAEAQKRNQMPLTQPVPGQGLSALPVTQRYSRESWLWNRRKAEA